MTIDHAGTAQRDQVNFFFLAWFKTDSGARGNIQAHPVSRIAFKDQRGVDLKKVKMATNLDRAITRVANKHRNSSSPAIGLDITSSLIEQIFSWFHTCSAFLSRPQRIGSCTV